MNQAASDYTFSGIKTDLTLLSVAEIAANADSAVAPPPDLFPNGID
jgi:hypothetical protein